MISMNLNKISKYFLDEYNQFKKNFLRPWRIFTDIDFIDDIIGKTVISFETSGCMANIRTFDYVGTILEIETRNELKFYKVRVLLDREGYEFDRENMEDIKTKIVPSWYLRDIDGKLFVYET